MIWHVVGWIAGIAVAIVVILGCLLMFMAHCQDFPYDESEPHP